MVIKPLKFVPKLSQHKLRLIRKIFTSNLGALDKLKDNNKLRIPMIMNSRSLNLSNSVAITVYEGLRQNKFENLV